MRAALDTIAAPAATLLRPRTRRGRRFAVFRVAAAPVLRGVAAARLKQVPRVASVTGGVQASRLAEQRPGYGPGSWKGAGRVEDPRIAPKWAQITPPAPLRPLTAGGRHGQSSKDP